MTENENKRIAELTVDAIKKAAESTKAAMLAAVEAAEEKSRELRDTTMAFIAELDKATDEVTLNANSHIRACQTVLESFQAHHLKILTPTPEPTVGIAIIEPPLHSPRAREEALDRLSEFAGQRKPVPPPPAPLRGSVDR